MHELSIASDPIMLKAHVYLYNVLQEPSFQKCEVPLVWWPWWPFNAADVFMGSLLPLERMLREGAISSQVRPVPVLDGLRLPAFYQWWFAPFFERKVCSSPSCA